MSEDSRGHAASVMSVTGYEVYEVGNTYDGIFQNMHMGGVVSLRGDYGMRRKICLRGGRIMVWEECSMGYLRDLCVGVSE